MGANISYRQVKPITGKDLPVGAPSYFIGTMEKAFGNFPCTLTSEDIPILRGMAATMRDEQQNPYEKLVEAIERMGAVEVYAEY